MAAFDNLLAAGIIGMIFLMVYLRMSGQTLGQVMGDVIEAFSSKTEEVEFKDF
jgi:hypothetical protein